MRLRNTVRTALRGVLLCGAVGVPTGLVADLLYPRTAVGAVLLAAAGGVAVGAFAMGTLERCWHPIVNDWRARLADALQLSLLLGGVAAVVWPVVSSNWDHSAAFQERLGRFLLETPPPERHGPLRPPLVVLDRTARRIEARSFALPHDRRPRRPDDVGSAAWIDKALVDVGSYTFGGKARQHVWTVTLVDLRDRVTLDRKVFEGGPPPSTVLAGASGVGNSPEAEVFRYLAAYPRRD